jgi:hypothetical protein
VGKALSPPDRQDVSVAAHDHRVRLAAEAVGLPLAKV